MSTATPTTITTPSAAKAITTTTIRAAARTITGRRKRNEDAYLLDAELGVFAVIDGMGGYTGGEVASNLAAQTIAAFYAAVADDPEATWPYALDHARTLAENRVDAAIRLANRRIRDAREGSLRDMGATIALIAIGRGGAVVGHLGDSRIYRLRRPWLRAPHLVQLTRDHSLYEQLKAAGAELPPLSEFVHANVVTRALGPAEDERPELARVELEDGDRFLLCTDGLSGPLTPEAIAEIMATTAIEEVSEALVDAAFEAGSRDNITAIVVDVARGQR
ncbi:MAG: serine/threonine-protein phosphatase [Myxococcales bacterium]|nr:serine/threonine-protein phosphatase [Myxococcales bacterium]MCB9704531.1 serine/threonine-protein phosphatase [Myxococcales bacterium]